MPEPPIDVFPLSSGINSQDFMSQEHGFTRMDWDNLWSAIEADAEDKESAWEEAKVAWCDEIRADLGGSARRSIGTNNEGVAMQLPRALAASFEAGLKSNHAARWWHSLVQSQYPILADDLIERHRSFWNEENIQAFWAGTTFQEVGEPNELSYSLAETFISRLSAQWETFLGFLSTAHYCDGGQTAALDHLGFSLGEIAEQLLGPGEWRPIRKELVRQWELRQSTDSGVAGARTAT